MARSMEHDDALQARALSRVVRAETWRRERIVNHFRFALFSLVGLAEWAQRSHHDHPHLSAMPFVFLAWGVTIEVLNLTWLRRHFKAWMPAAITTIDIAVVTIAIRIIYGHAVQYGEPALREIDRAMVGLIAMVSANIARFSWRTSVWSGVCALISLGYLRAYSETFGQTAIATDFLVFGGIVALLVYANRNFRTVTARLLFDLRRAQEQRLSSLRALVAGVCHEVNSPLGTISGNLQLVTRATQILGDHVNQPDAEVRRALESVQQSSEANRMATSRISTIVRTLRDFARSDEDDVGRVDLRRDIDTCTKLLATEVGDRIEFVHRCPEPLEVTCRPAQINQVLMHVLRNAVQSIDGGGTVTILGVREADMVRIDVVDTGRGIPKKNLAGIFDLQFGRKGERVSMGLGLPISYSIIQDHGGTIDVDSSAGVGTKVTVRLPTA